MKELWAWLEVNSSQLQALSSAVQIIGIVVVIVGMFLAYKQLRLTAEQVRYAAAQTQGTIVQETAKTSRELLMKVWDDPNLRHLLDSSAPNPEPGKVDAFLKVLINHFATIFRQWKLGNIPQAYWEEVARDAKQFFKSPEVQTRWPQVKDFYKEDFQEFVDRL
jgi:hypothetical protein